MLRYFVAGQFWFLVFLAMLLGSGYARHSPDYYNLYGVGFIEPSLFQFAISLTLALSVLCLWGWWRSREKFETSPKRPTHELDA